MINSKNRKILYIVICSMMFFGVWPDKAKAARLYFSPQEAVIGTEGNFLTALNITAEKPVNAFSVAVLFSPEVFPYDINEGSSVVNLWLDKPHWDEAARLLTFSGITPGGFEGRDAPLLILKLRVKEESEGEALLSFNKEQTKIFLHSPDGIEDALELADLRLPISKGKENLPVNPPDLEPPESFKPEIAHDLNIFNNKYFLTFNAQDKGSGLLRYEIVERRGELVKDYNKLRWQAAASPYELRDQELKSYVYVKAIDKAGNERIVELFPQAPLSWREQYFKKYATIVIGLIIIYIIWKKARRNLQKSRSIKK